MPLAQSIHFSWVACVSPVAVIATYQLAPNSLSVLSKEEALHAFDGTQWLIKLGPAAASSVSATFKENDSQSEPTADGVPATFRENDLRNETAIDIPISRTLKNDLQKSTTLSIPTSSSLIVEATQVLVENKSSDTRADGGNISSAEKEPEKLLHQNKKNLWLWLTNSKNIVNTTLCRI